MAGEPLHFHNFINELEKQLTKVKDYVKGYTESTKSVKSLDENVMKTWSRL
ncbi:hypothetical protein D3C80_2205060 [compost metagenome]